MQWLRANHLFQVVPPEDLDTERSVMRPLRRAAAEELQLLAVLSPVACSNLAVPFSKEIFATDASNTGGGIAVAEADEEVVKMAWRSADRKGSNVPMMRKTQAILASHDMDFEEVPIHDELSNAGASVARPLGLHFEFIELCGGSGVVTKALIRKGFDLSFSKQFDLKQRRVCWLWYLSQWEVCSYKMESRRCPFKK